MRGVEGEEVEAGGEAGGGDGELSGVDGDGEEFMACGIVEGEAAAAEVGEQGGEGDGDGLACGVGVEGEEWFGVGGRDGAGEDEECGELDVLCDDAGAGVVGGEVVPALEEEAVAWSGGEGDRRAFGVDSGAYHGAAGGVGAESVDHIAFFRAEEGGEGGVGGEVDGARVVGVAVVPVGETEAGTGVGGEFDKGEV